MKVSLIGTTGCAGQGLKTFSDDPTSHLYKSTTIPLTKNKGL